MPKFPEKISDARILISNDDGIHADGIKILEEIALTLSPKVWVVAPETQQSAAGHSLSIHMPLRMKKYDDRHVSVYGTPTDSVLFGVQTVMKGTRPHLVLSGINHGQNTADDVTYSGTIAAAIEATLLGIPAVAFSQDFPEEHTGTGKPDWSIAKKYLPKILELLQGTEWSQNTLISVNFPAFVEGKEPEIRVVSQGHFSVEDQEMAARVDPRGRPYFWIGPPPKKNAPNEETDIGALGAGHITVTPLSLNLTHVPTLEKLREVFK